MTVSKISEHGLYFNLRRTHKARIATSKKQKKFMQYVKKMKEKMLSGNKFQKRIASVSVKPSEYLDQRMQEEVKRFYILLSCIPYTTKAT